MSYEVRITGDQKVVALLDKLRNLHIVLLEDLQDRIYEAARKNVPVRTGLLRSSIEKGGFGNVLYVSMGNARAYYAPFVEYGTRPHVIYPRRAQALRFEVRGQVIFAKYVRHPGSKPRHVMRRSTEEVLKEFRRILRRKVLELLR
ncbi:MAG: HK97-gp10 family putative phage morphogenesis protein [Candidatus Methanospirareceae archaeon]